MLTVDVGKVRYPRYKFANGETRFPGKALVDCNESLLPIDHNGFINVFLLFPVDKKKQFLSLMDNFLNGTTVKYNGFEKCWKGYYSQMGVKLEIVDTVQVDRVKDYINASMDLVRRIREEQIKNPFVIALLPENSVLWGNLYLDLKGVFIPNGIPEQFIREEKLDSYLTNQKLIHFYPVLAYNVHSKAGFRTFTLSTEEAALEIGWDITRVSERGKTISVGAAVEVFLNDGIMLRSTGGGFVQPGEAMFDIQKVITESIISHRGDLKNISKIFLRRDGPIPREEVKLITDTIRGLEETGYDLPDIVLVEEIKENPFRVTTENGENPPNGIYIKLNDRELILLTTGKNDFLVGTAKPLKVKWTPIKGETTSIEVAQDTFNMSRIHIASPYRLIRTSMPTYFADKHAYFAGRNIAPMPPLNNRPWFI